MFELRKKGGVEYFAATAWDAFPGLSHAFCTRRGGVSSGAYGTLNMSSREGEEETTVRANWDIAAAAFGLSRRQFFRVSQVHGDKVLVIDDGARITSSCRPLEYDAVITSRTGLAVCVLTADCVPVLMTDPVRRLVAAVHAGWRGTALNISGQVLALCKERFGSRPEDIRTAIGPAIGPCCYEVDDTVRAAMVRHPARDACFSAGPEKGKWQLDLPLANRLQLEAAGIPGENIQMARLCTSCRSGEFYSHRGAGGKTGRLLNFILVHDHGQPAAGPAATAC